MSDIYKLMSDFLIDSNVIKLKNYCYSLSFMEILRVPRKEDVHSSFLAWLFDPRYNYDLKNKPLELLLNLLIHEDLNNISVEDKRNLFFNKNNLILSFVQRELPIGDNGRVDIFIEFSLMNNQYAIVIENKVESSENVEVPDKGEIIFQTDKYYDYFKEDEDKKYIYVFLSPTNAGNKVKANNENFINISYDDIVKSIINPLLSNENLSEKTKLILEDYVKVLSKPFVIKYNKESVKLDSMLSSEDCDYKKILIKKLREEYKNLGDLLLNSIKQRKTIKDDEPSKYKDIENFIINNKLIIELIWPEIAKFRDSDVTFAELKLPIGTTLYLAKSERSNIRDQREISAIIYDDESAVSYEIDGKFKVDKISNAARELSGKCYGLRGISWFIYNDGNRDINLFKLNEEKK